MNYNINGGNTVDPTVNKERLLNTIRCILLNHNILRINGTLSGSDQDELVLMEMVEKEHDCTFVARD